MVYFIYAQTDFSRFLKWLILIFLKVHHNQDLHNFIEARLRKQQEDSEKDSQWLQQQEENIKKRLSVASMNDIGTESLITGKPPIAEKPSQQSSKTTNETSSIVSSSQGLDKKDGIDRKNDPVYLCTTSVVKAVMKLSNGVEKSQVEEYLELVKFVGIELRTLLGTVDEMSAQFPSQTYK